MKHLFIINPVAGGKKNRSAETEAAIRDFMAEHGGDFEIYYTKAPMDACSRIRDEAADGGELRVYACGGDGTLNECVNGVVGFPDAAVTHFPCGTGNDFVKMFGPGDAKLFTRLDELTGGFVRPLDVIDCSGRYGINICSVGIDARIGTDVHKYSRIPIIGGATGYVVSLVVNMLRGINQRLRVAFPDGETDGEHALICACNGRFYGGGFNPVPDAMPDDGVMDVLVVEPVSIFKVPALIGKYAKGRYRELPKLISRRAETRMELSAPRAFVVNIDGEAVFTDRISFSVVPGGVNFLFPRSMSFFRTRGELASAAV